MYSHVELGTYLYSAASLGIGKSFSRNRRRIGTVGEADSSLPDALLLLSLLNRRVTSMISLLALCR
jgi:hypothetical protein